MMTLLTLLIGRLMAFSSASKGHEERIAVIGFVMPTY